MLGRSHGKRIADKLRITTVLPGNYVTADLEYESASFDTSTETKQQANADIKFWRILHTNYR